MKKLILTFCLFTAILAAQSLPEEMLMTIKAPAAAPAADWYPTNLPNCLGWWVADNYTSGNLPDSWVNGYHLTNLQANTTVPFSSNNWLNGHAILKFDGNNDYVKNANYACNQPHEINILARMITSASYKIALDGNGFRHVIYLEADGTFTVRAGFDVVCGGNKAGSWMIFSLVFNGANSRLYTNNVLNTSGNAGSDQISGLILGDYWGGGYAASYEFAEMVTYSVTNSAANRTMIYSNWNQKYNLGLP